MLNKAKRKESEPEFHGYQITTGWSDEDKCYLVRFPELPGCMTHGDTMQDAIINARDALDLYLETCEVNHIQVPLPIDRQRFSGTFTARIGPEMHRKLSKEALLLEISMSDLVKQKLAKG